MGALLTIHGLSVILGDAPVLWDVSLDVAEGEITTIVGPNGAGKTTLLQTISGLHRAAGGTIHFRGERMNGLTSAEIVERGIVQVPEGRHLFPAMTVLENLELGAYTKRARKEAAATMAWAFDLFPHLKSRRRQLAGTLSGGEQQMLAIARALMLQPTLLMLDEPSYGLAPRLVLHLFDIVGDLHRGGLTILLVEQNVRHALLLAQTGYVLETGRIVAAGPAGTLVEAEEVKRVYLGM